MNARNLVYVLAILFATAAISADNKGSGTISGTVNGAEIGKETPKQNDKDQPPPHATCLSQCAASEQRCSREVRHARTECQRVAANGGRDVFSGRPRRFVQRHRLRRVLQLLRESGCQLPRGLLQQ